MAKRTFFLILMAVLMSCKMTAKSIVFVLTDSTKVYYVIKSSWAMYKNIAPTIKLEANGFSVNNDKYEFDRFDHFYFSKENGPTGIENILSKRMKMDNGCLVVEGAHEVQVYTIDGKRVDVQTQREGNKTVIDTTTLAPGGYVVKIGRESLKIWRRK